MEEAIVLGNKPNKNQKTRYLRLRIVQRINNFENQSKILLLIKRIMLKRPHRLSGWVRPVTLAVISALIISFPVKAAERIFSLLPAEQKKEFMTLWQEFESRESAESKFAHCVDRIAAFFLNVGNNGGTWIQHSIAYETVVERNQHAAEGSTTIWEQSIELINQHFQQAETSRS